MNMDWKKFWVNVVCLVVVVFWAVVFLLLLTSCEVLDLNEEPVEVVCEATCEDCKNVVLRCDGTGRAQNQKETNIKPTGALR